jgi:hypothetical protein
MAIAARYNLVETFNHIRTTHTYGMDNADQSYLTATDSMPIVSAGSFGKNGTPTYYFMDDPDKTELYYQARKTPLGFRLTYAFADDVWNNNFGYRFEGQKLEESDIKEINNEIADHYKTIGFYDMARLATAFDYEQGESLLNIYREGDGALKYDQIESGDPNYAGFQTPADTTKDIIRVEAINHIDYTIPQIEAFGDPTYYRINFYTDNNMYMSYNVHPTRAIRWRSHPINYDQYKGQGILHACFGHLQILNTIDYSAMSAAYRWGHGKPVVFTRGIKTQQDATYAAARIGNPTTQSWIMVPKENVEDIKMLGSEGTMMNLSEMGNMIINQIASVTGIPKPILMGEQAGVISGSEVNERQYFAVLDRQHNKLNRFIRQFNNIDPFFQRLLKKWNITSYEIDWGLRQVMTKMEEADYQMRLYNNARAAMSFKTYDEIRMGLGLPRFKDVPEIAKYAEEMYGIKAEQLGTIVPDLGQWKQRIMQEIIETPEEQEAKELEKNNVPNAMKTEQGQGGSGTGENPIQREAQRRENKMARKMSGGYGGRDEEMPDVDRMVVEDMERKLREYAQIIDQLRSDSSMTKLAEKMEIPRSTLCRLFDRIKEVSDK